MYDHSEIHGFYSHQARLHWLTIGSGTNGGEDFCCNSHSSTIYRFFMIIASIMYLSYFNCCVALGHKFCLSKFSESKFAHYLMMMCYFASTGKIARLILREAKSQKHFHSYFVFTYLALNK
jgi:hypothetical protein